ncbi:Uncharacterized protein XB16_3517 [Leptospira santarosai]|uniref:Uncharacterized protein n=1 Tax=Leptospira santarosai TaxID=28183 RepID=A0A2P1QY07_9LEPT|nr:Uncharacterized protein XB16_3517 [Leptospira santarosai]
MRNVSKTSYLFVLIIILFFLTDHCKKKLEKEETSGDETKKQISTNLSSDMERTWKRFVNAIQSDDAVEIKKLSTNCIYCTTCVTNTAKEKSSFETLEKKNFETVYDKLYSDFSYIPIDRFIREDKPIIFDSTIKSKLSGKIKYDSSWIKAADVHNQACILSKAKFKTAQKYQVYHIRISIPDDWVSLFLTEEITDYVFAFIQTEDGYKYYEFSQIP